MPPEPFTAIDSPIGRSHNHSRDSSGSGLFLLAPAAHHDHTAATFAWTGRFFLGLSFLVFGAQELRYAGFVPDLGLVPYGAPAHRLFSWLAGAVLLLAGSAILTGKYQRTLTFLLGFVFLLAACSRFAFHIPRLVTSVSYRTVFFELLACAAGSWMIASLLPAHDSRLPSAAIAQSFATVGLWIVAIASIVFGIGHFQVPAFIASIIPHWIPFRLFLAWCTGVAFVAAGLSIATRVRTRLGAALLGLMFFLWVLIVHAPRIAHALHNGDEWNSGFVCLTMAGCALLAAALAPRTRTQSVAPLSEGS
ncbi:MAG: DoxX family membrane protein [Acidobacteriaceae bacterium]